jgi:hypothetical protein
VAERVLGGRVMVGIGRVCQVWFLRLLGGGMMQVDFERPEMV